VSSCDLYLGSLVNTLLPREQGDIIILRQPEMSGPLALSPDEPPNPRQPQ